MKRLIKYWWAAVLIFGLPLLLYAAGWKATYTELAEAPAAADAFLLVDVSDTTMAATGTTKWISYANIGLQPLDLDLTTFAALACDDGEILAHAAGAWECGTAAVTAVDGLTEDTVDDGYLDKAAIALAAKSVTQAASLGDDGELTPTAGYFVIDIALTCTADNADIVMIETGAIEGALAIITNVAANTCRFNDSAGVSELKTATVSLEQEDVLILHYHTDAWYEVSRNQATLALASISSAVPFTDGATGGAYIKFLEDSDNGTDYSSIKGADNAGSFPSFTFGGSQGSEDLTVTATANTWTWSSSSGVTLVSFEALPLAGGSLTPVIADADTFDDDFTGANLYGGTFISSAAGSVLLPNATVGMNFTIVLETTGDTIIEPLATGTDDTIYMNGLAAAQGESIHSTTRGAMCVFQYRAADTWMATCNGFAEATPP